MDWSLFKDRLFEIDILDRSFSTDRLFEIGPLDTFLSKDRFSKSAPWIGLFLKIDFFEMDILLCDGPIGMVRYVSEVCQVM